MRAAPRGTIGAWLALALVATVACHREEPPAAQHGPRMHGYALSDFGDFAHEWRLVTTRFRQDSFEQRFTWANPLAMQTLAAGKADYPDGAAFAKVGFLVKDDPAFTSSLVPSGTRRYQFMVRDAKRFAATDGWGYVIFNNEGNLFPGDEVEASNACAACHRLVEKRGFVFSQPLKLEPRNEPEPRDPHPPTAAVEVHFDDMAVTELPADVQRLLPTGTATVRWLKGELRRHIFGGTLHELRPMLIDAAVKSGRPAVVVAEDQKRSAVAWRDAAEKEPCPAGGMRVRYAYGEPVPGSFTPRPGHSETVIRVGTLCMDVARR